MESASASRIYTQIEPNYQWVPGEEFDTLLVDVSEFTKQQLKVQADTERNLIISGERPMEGNRWCHFLKSFQLPEDCNARMIKAKLDEGILYVVVPKTTAEDHPSQQTNGRAYKEQDVDEKKEGLTKHRQWILNILVAIIVVAGLGAYAGYKLSHKRDT
uniref:Inactive protein RESTRICTED TEV MOVEMENT 2 n=2 Tax=Elaeis guineensis var. tenera TaxID=51953 RepID=A0A6I9R161_ELAGV|nr:inactive protein RESTRICTED TEV MOVEMENT 2 [Elaeis guineensis]